MEKLINDAQDLSNGAKDLSAKSFSGKATQVRAKLNEGTETLRDHERKFVDEAERVSVGEFKNVVETPGVRFELTE